MNIVSHRGSIMQSLVEWYEDNVSLWKQPNELGTCVDVKGLNIVYQVL